ncbi:MAG: hypothetical protein JNK32_04915 [Anaerolineales bacterium]|nr:hypothetical protein [Anaerolineales bacterium]
MSDLDFGSQLRLFRQRSHDPQTQKQLSQQKLGELLGLELGVYGFSGAAISDWERSESRINAADRHVLLSLVKVLNFCGGIKNSADANLLLEAGNYRALNQAERNRVFPEEVEETGSPPATSLTSNFQYLTRGMPFISPAGYKKILLEAREGPQPAWPKVLAALMRNTTDRVSAINLLKTILWLWVLGLAYWLILPSLRLFLTSGDLRQAASLYIIGSLILPLLIAALTDTNKEPFWKEQKIPRPVRLRLFVHAGAYLGFHTGYFIVFLFTFIQGLLDIPPVTLIELFKAAFLIAFGYIDAQLIPYNLWLAYQHFDFKESGILFAFIPFGLVWAWFLVEFYETLASPVTGTILLLSSVTLIALWEVRKSRN